MCNSIFFSTDSVEDFSRLTTKRLAVEPLWSGEEAAAVVMLDHPNRCFLTREFGGCSCYFRTYATEVNSHPPSFDEPYDWCPEDDDDIEATAEFYRMIKHLLVSGHQVDTVCILNDPSVDAMTSIEVDLSLVSESSFKFFDNYHFKFC
jgi:hypothetical protein